MTPDDPDDWFSDESAPVDEDWTGEHPAVSARGRPPFLEKNLTPRNAAIGGAILLVLIVAGLWIGGAFSSSKKNPATTTLPVTTNQTPTTTPKPPAVKAPTTVLSPGSHGVQVGLLQKALEHLGYSPGTIDGAYGPSTQAAVKKFQQAQGLTPDGIVGPKTLAALKTALQNQG
jgi:hypothetical protein